MCADISKTEIVDRYMTLFDRAIAGEASATDELLGLFADGATIDLLAAPLTGEEMERLYRTIPQMADASFHHWTTEELPDGRVRAVWANSARGVDGSVSARAGVEHFTFDEQGRITHLHNEPAGVLQPGQPDAA